MCWEFGFEFEVALADYVYRRWLYNVDQWRSHKEFIEPLTLGKDRNYLLVGFLPIQKMNSGLNHHLI